MLKILIEIAGIQALLFSAYYLFLRKETDYRWRRIFLLIILVLSLIVPFLHIQAPAAISEVSNVYIPDFNGIPNVTKTSTQSFSIDWINISLSIGIVGTLLFALVMIFSFYQILYLKKIGIPKPLGRLWVWMHPNVNGSFSFFNWIFSKKFEPTIIAHEVAHVELRHSYDRLLLQLNRSLFWWNPVSWWMLKEMTQIHEYQADQKVLEENNIDEYQELLINTTLSSMGWGLASSFHSGSLLKRLYAMKQQTRKISHWKISTLGALVAIIALVFACEELDQDIRKMSKDSRQISFEELPKDLQSNLVGKQDQYTYLLTYTDNVETSAMKEKLSQMDEIDPQLIEMVDVKKNESGGEIYIVLRKDASSYEYVEEKSIASDGVFTLVDEQPEFTGGMTSFYQYIGENIKYPEAAKRMGIQGRVFVQFIVDETGKVTDVKAVKGIGAGCDEVAEKVIAASPNFEPGKQNGKPVKVRMVVPIIFSLEDSEETGAVEINVDINDNDQSQIIRNNQLGMTPEATSKIEQPREPTPSGELFYADGEEISQYNQVAKTVAHVIEAETVKAITPSPTFPSYEGGMDQLYQDIFDELNYPEQAKKYKIEGNVAVQFIVRRDGSIENVIAIKGIGGGCEEEAVRVVKTLNKFKPALKEDQPIDATMVLPINFRL